MRLLLVENHAVFAATVTQLFLADHEVRTVGSLALARAALLQGEFDAVLVDFDLDDGKGDALIRELILAGFRGRIVAISGRQAGNEALVEAGAHACCPKAQFQNIGAALAP